MVLRGCSEGQWNRSSLWEGTKPKKEVNLKIFANELKLCPWVSLDSSFISVFMDLYLLGRAGLRPAWAQKRVLCPDWGWEHVSRVLSSSLHHLSRQSAKGSPIHSHTEQGFIKHSPCMRHRAQHQCIWTRTVAGALSLDAEECVVCVEHQEGQDNKGQTVPGGCGRCNT